MKVRATISVELDGAQIELTVEGNAPQAGGLSGVGAFIGRRVDLQVSKLLAASEQKATGDA